MSEWGILWYDIRERYVFQRQQAPDWLNCWQQVLFIQAWTAANHQYCSNVSVFPQTQTHHLKADIHSSLQMFLIQLLLQAVILNITYCVRVVLADYSYMLSNAIKIKFLPSLDPRRCLLALLRPKFTSESLPTSRPRHSTVVLIYPLIVSWWVWCLSVKQSGISFLPVVWLVVMEHHYAEGTPYPLMNEHPLSEAVKDHRDERRGCAERRGCMLIVKCFLP